MHLISDEKRTVVYTCYRDGGYKGCDQERKTSKKRNSKESQKLPCEKFCLAGMTAKEDLKTGVVTVIYTATHINHTLELSECKHLPLPMQKCDKSEDIVSKGGTNGKSHGWYGMVPYSIIKVHNFLQRSAVIWVVV